MFNNLNIRLNNKADDGILTLGRFRTNINLICNNLREIYHTNYSFFGLGFIFIYAIEQVLLLYFSIKLSPSIALGISLFILIMLTTIAIERMLMESRTKRLSELNSEYLYLNKKYQDNIDILKKQNRKMSNFLDGSK